jgi:hypothetical protein
MNCLKEKKRKATDDYCAANALISVKPMSVKRGAQSKCLKNISLYFWH